MNGESDAHDNGQVETRLRLAVERLDRRLTEQEIAMVRSRIARLHTVLEQIRAIPLANGDEPEPMFDPSPSNNPGNHAS